MWHDGDRSEPSESEPIAITVESTPLADVSAEDRKNRTIPEVNMVVEFKTP